MVRATRLAAAGVRSRFAAPLCNTALWNRPRARGMASSAAMLPAPADWPTTVTFAGSPPKAAISPCTQARAASWSSSPACPVAGSAVPHTSTPRR